MPSCNASVTNYVLEGTSRTSAIQKAKYVSMEAE